MTDPLIGTEVNANGIAGVVEKVLDENGKDVIVKLTDGQQVSLPDSAVKSHRDSKRG